MLRWESMRRASSRTRDIRRIIRASLEVQQGLSVVVAYSGDGSKRVHGCRVEFRLEQTRVA